MCAIVSISFPDESICLFAAWVKPEPLAVVLELFCCYSTIFWLLCIIPDGLANTD